MLTDERRRRIVLATETDGTVRVGELARALGVSEMTVRRDLDLLAADGYVRKVRGGAVRSHARGEEPLASEKAQLRHEFKAAIAAVAAERVTEGMTIAIGAGSTTLELAKALLWRSDLTVLTNSLAVFSLLTNGPENRSPMTYLSGGSRTPSDALVGPIAESTIDGFRVDATFLGAHAIDDSSLATPNLAEASTNRHLREIADQLVVLADSSKFGEVGACVFADLSQISLLVTDVELDEAARLAAEKKVGELVAVDPSESAG